MANIKMAVLLSVLQVTAFCSGLRTPQQLRFHGDRPYYPDENGATTLAAENINTEAVIQAVAYLDSLQNDTQGIADDIKNSITNAIEDVQQVLTDAVNRWNQTVQQVEAIVRAVISAEDDCLLSGTPLDNVTLGLKYDLISCFQDDSNTVYDLQQRIDDILYKINLLSRDTLRTTNVCGAADLANNVLCWTENLPDLTERTLSLVIEVQLTELESLTIIDLLISQTDVCAALAVLQRTRQAASLIQNSVKCVANYKPIL